MFATKRKDVNKHGIQVKAHARKRRYHDRNLCRTTSQQRKDMSKQVNRTHTYEPELLICHRLQKGRSVYEVYEHEAIYQELLAEGYLVVDTYREHI